MPLVSIIVPAYNAAHFVAETLGSVVASDFGDYEIVVIDDGSTDDTAETALRVAPHARVLRQPNAGLSAARNRGIAESDSEFIALLDADDLWHPRKLALQVRALRDWPAAGLSYTEFFAWDGTSTPDFACDPGSALDERLSGWIYDKMVLTNFVLPSTVLMRRSVVEAVGPILCDNQKTDDWEYFTRLSRTAPFSKLAAPLVAYRQSPGSLSRKVGPVNVTELMRDELIARFGLVSPQGIAVDADELRRRRYKGHRDFADAHLARGSMRIGVHSFARLLVEGPQRAATVSTLLKSLLRRMRSQAQR